MNNGLLDLPKLPPGLIETGRFSIDHSSCSRIEKCFRAGWHHIVWGLVSARRDPAQGFGRAVHSGLDVRQRALMRGEKPSLEAMEAAAERDFYEWDKCWNCDGEGLVSLTACEDCQGTGKVRRLVELPENEYRTLGRAKEVLGLYLKRWEDEPFEVVASEQGLEAKLGEVVWREAVERESTTLVNKHHTQIFWKGKLDGIWKGQTGYAIKDTKTMRELGDLGLADKEAQYKLDGQMKGYCFLASAASHWGKVRQAVIDVVVCRRPKVKLTNSDKPRNQFERVLVEFSDEEIEQWRQNTLGLIGDWLTACGSHLRPPRMTSDGFRCGRCCYQKVCLAPTEHDRVRMLTGGDFKVNDFDPLKEAGEEEGL